MNQFIDLHTHSTASDGTLSPKELVKFAKDSGLSAIALCDHDTVAGIPEFMEAGKRYDVETIPGVEVSAKYDTEMHILGLYVDADNQEFQRVLRGLKDSRRVRNETMLRLVQEHGFEITEEDVTGQKQGGRLENTGRAHIARAMVEKGYVSDVQEAFTKYLKRGNPCYVERKTYPPKETIELIHRAGGLAVLAHPIFITKDAQKLEELLLWLKEYGLDGVESYYSEYSSEYRDLCVSLCQRLGLVPTGGSDFHADNKPHIKIGTVLGGTETIPYSILTGLKQRR